MIAPKFCSGWNGGGLDVEPLKKFKQTTWEVELEKAHFGYSLTKKASTIDARFSSHQRFIARSKQMEQDDF